MRLLDLINLTILLLILSNLYLNAQCNIDDWNALKDLYISTNGDDWTDNTNWAILMHNSPPVNCNLSDLFGIRTNFNGRIFEINLYNNNLSGTLPSTIGNLAAIEQLYLGNDPIIGEIPLEIGNLNNLKTLSLSDTEVNGIIPSSLTNLTNLKILYLFNNNLSGNIPALFNNLTMLEFLYLQNNQLSGNLPPEIGDLTNLKRLYISGNLLEGCYPPNWSVLCDQLTFGFISEGNNLDASWTSFCSVGIGICPANQQLCNLQDWLALKVFYASTNGNNWGVNTNWTTIEGISPPVNCNLGDLYGVELDTSGRVSEIILFGNNLTGTLPSEIGLLTELTSLYLNNNLISGNIPTEIGNLLNLNTLSIPNNQLAGSIPISIGSLNSLTTLYLNTNQLSGYIPQEFGNLGNLQTLFLFSNQLSGTIPASFSHIGNLTSFHIGFNQLSGCFYEALSSLCIQLQFFEINNGNSFDTTWEEFCQSMAGSCTTFNSSNVWPGDVNYDGIANSIDIMHLGNYLFESKKDAANLNPGEDWQAYNRIDWGTNQHADFCYNGNDDLKHADCNGNGTIDGLDLAVIEQNWGKTHNDAPSIQSPIPCFFFDDFSDYKLTLQPIGSLDTNLIVFNISLSNQQKLVSIRSGFININYYNTNGTNLIDAIINLSNSWMGIPGINLWHHNVFNPTFNNVEMGFTKNDLSDSTGEGIIGSVAFLLNDLNTSTINNIADIAIELGFQNSDTTSVFIREIFEVDLGNGLCESNLLLTEASPMKNEYTSLDTLYTQGEVIIYSQQLVTYKAADRINLNIGFSVEAGATFRVVNEACD